MPAPKTPVITEPTPQSDLIKRPDGSHVRAEASWLDDEIDFGRYIRPLRAHWLLVVMAGVIGALAGLGSAMLKPVLYEASTTILLARTGNQTQSDVATSRALLQNHTLAASTIQEVGIDRGPAPMTAQRFVEDALTIAEVSGANLLRVQVRLGDPKAAADASRILSQKAVELSAEIASGRSTALRGQLKAHLDDAADRRKHAEQQLVAYRSQAQIEVLRRDTDAMLRERGDLLTLVVGIEAEKARLASAENEIQKQEPVLSGSRSVGAEAALRRVGREAEPAPVPGSPQRAIDPQDLDLTHPLINPVYQTLAFQIATSRSRLAALERERQELVITRKLGAKQFNELKELYAREIEVAKLEDGYQLAKRVHGDLVLKYEGSRSESISSVVQLQIVDQALPPERPLSRKRGVFFGAGLLAGLLLAGLGVLAFAKPGSVR